MSAFGYATNISDPVLKGEVRAQSEEEQQNYNRKMVNLQLSNILKENGIDLSGKDLSFVIEPYTYELRILGLDDENLQEKIKNILSQNDNAKELFFHILQSLKFDKFEFNEGVLEKSRK